MVVKSATYVKFCKVVMLGLLVGTSSFAQTPTTISTTTTTPATQSKKFNLKIKGSLGDKSFANENSERSQQVSLLLGANADYKLHSTLSMTADMILLGTSSQVFSRFGDNVSNSGLYIGEALIKWQPLDFFSIHAGAVNQKYLQSPLLISSSSTFPGVKESLQFNLDKNILNLSLEQTIPTSTTLSTKTADREVSPAFFAESVSFKSQMIKSVELEIFGSLFHFQDLPSQVALESTVYGNSTPEFLGPNTARFMYDFSGWMVGANSKTEFPKVMNLNLGGHILENMEAPLAYGQGQLVYIGTEFLFSKNFSIEPRFESFFNESDSTPAFYNSAEYGHNNRQGFGAEVILNFKDPAFVITSKYVQADTINKNINQTKQQYFSIRLETSYDLL